MVQPGKPITEYRQLARLENEKNKPLYIHETTIYDLLHGLRLEYNELYNVALKSSRTGVRGAKVNHRVVAERYDGGDHSKRTYVRQAVSVAVRLSERTIEAIGKVCNEDCAQLILVDKEMNRSNMKSVDEVYLHKDSRLFRSFVCFGSLKGTKSFMNAVMDDNENAQVNTIFRLRHWSELNGFKPVQSSTVSDQFCLSILSLKEEEKFLSILAEKEWPDHMDNTKENLLRTTVFDNELRLNSGNDKDILPSIWRSFKRLYPTRARSIEQEQENDKDEGEDTAEEDTQPPSANADTEETNEEIERNKEREELKRKRDQFIRSWKTKQVSADENLKESRISAYRMSFMDYIKHISSLSVPKVDLVLSAIPNELSEEDLKSIPLFCKSVLKPGSYVFLILTEKQFTLFLEQFQSNGFKVMDHCFKIIYDVSTFQRRSTTDFPQRHGDIALMAKTEGQHPDGYQPDFKEQVQFGSVINIKACQKKLRKPNQTASIRTSEKSIDLFNHIIKMLTPSGGSVIDPIAGPMTASISCLETGRSCVSIESDEECYKFALGRTRIYASPEATMEHLHLFVEPIDVDAIDFDSLNYNKSTPSASNSGPQFKRRKKGNQQIEHILQEDARNQSIDGVDSNNILDQQQSMSEEVEALLLIGGEKNVVDEKSSSSLEH